MCLRNYIQIRWSLRSLKHLKSCQRYPQDLKHLDRKDLSHPCCNWRHPHLNQITHRNYQRRQKGGSLNIQQSRRYLQRCHQRHRWLTRPRCCCRKSIIRLNRRIINQTFEECYRPQEDQILHGTNGRPRLIIIRRRWLRRHRETRLIIDHLKSWSWSSMDCIRRIKRRLIIIIQRIKGNIHQLSYQTWGCWS